ncbi:acyltransferase domain-containing protein, partial [Micromonospora carbonacea]|uniref:acyltransferase domain-containing protein n=1 Tax=Micromonospora carbonacea TaxID=47853 RepID=UPI0037C51766
VGSVVGSYPGLEVAAWNGPRSVTVSGPVEVVDAFCAGSGLRCQRLVVSHAFHSVAMAGAVEPFAEVVSRVVVSAPRVGFASSITGGWHDAGSVADGGLWGGGIRRPVLFGEALGLVGAAGGGVFWDIGAHPVLTGLGKQVLPDPGLVWLPTLRRDRSDQAQLHAAVAEFYSRGLGEVDWAGVHAGKGHRTTTIPTYPFERRELSAPRVHETAPAHRRRPEAQVSVPTAGDEAGGHPLFDRHYEH